MNDLMVKEPMTDTVARVKEQVQTIQHVMKETMRVDEHFGIIPGCKKPSLYKAGAEKMLLTFKFSPNYEELSVLENENIISYRIRCTLVHYPTSHVVGSGLGACNSQENKYATKAVSILKATEEDKRASLREEERSYYDKGALKKFRVCIIPQKPWELQNTIYKMACKRALLAAVLNCTAASDIFTQDIDDDFVPDTTASATPTNVSSPKRMSETKQAEEPVANSSNIQTKGYGLYLEYNDKDRQEKAKAAGFRWDSEKKLWTISCDNIMAEALKKLFGSNFSELV